MRTLAIDFGERRIGLAISDADGQVAVPIEALFRRNDRQALEALADLVAAESVERLVVGEPRGLDGTRGPAAARVSRFARRLADRTGLEVELVDEALTSIEARSRLGSNRRRQPGRVDSVAAQILLQESLDRRRGGG